MDRRPVKSVRLLLLPALLVAALSFAALTISACGQGAAEKAIEKAAEQSGQDVDVDIDTKDGSVSVSGENGEMSWQAGEGVELPEGFPEGLLPDGAKVVSAMTSTESGSAAQIVVFETSTNDQDMYDQFLEDLPSSGYEITDKLRMESGEEGNAIAIQATGQEGTIMISGGGKTEDKYSYMIMVQP